MLEIREVVLETISPLHIGTKEVTYGWGMFKLKRQDNYAFIVDQRKLMSFLVDYNLVDRYVSEFDNPKKFAEKSKINRGESWIKIFLEEEGVFSKKSLEEKVQIAHKISSSIVYSPSQNGSFICNSKGNLFVPGSSIKGVLRTAVLYKILKDISHNDPILFETLVINNINNRFNEFYKENPTKKNQIKQEFAEEIIRSIFYPEAMTNAQFDFFKVVRVSDGQIFLPKVRHATQENIVILNIGRENNVSLKKNKYGKETILNKQCLPIGSKIKFKLLVDHKMVKGLIGQFNEEISQYIYTLEDPICLLEIAREFSQDQWEYEKRFFATWFRNTDFNLLTGYYNKDEVPALRLGWGTGILGTTIDLLLDNEHRQRIRNLNPDHNRPGLPAPKSRRVVRSSGSLLPLGWVKLSQN